MSTRKRSPATGIRARHSRSCAGGDRCTCKPSWEASVYSKRDGKKLRRVFPTQAAAKAWRAEVTSMVNRGELRGPVPTTVREAADEWLAGVRAGVIQTPKGHPYKPSTVRSYESALKERVLPEFGRRRLSDIDQLEVKDFADGLIAKGLNPSTVANTIDPLRAIYRRAIRRRLVAVNPTKDLELPKPKGKRDRIASREEAHTLLDALPSEHRALWATALYAGLRRGELRALRWCDIDLTAREILVSRGWDYVEGPIAVKTEAGARTVPILRELVSELARHKLLTGRGGEDLVFGRTADRPFTPARVARRAQEAWKAAGLERIGLHEARHTFASTAIAAGVNLKAISEAMGHSSITITIDRYGHLMPGAREEMAKRMDDYLAEGQSS